MISLLAFLPQRSFPSCPILPPLALLEQPFFHTSSRYLVDETAVIMDGSSPAKVTGVGVLTYQRAIDLARNTEGELDPAVREYLQTAINDIWLRIQADSNYVLTKDEFPLFNFYIRRFQGHEQAERAIARYWAVASRDS
nr:hypothetical protein CFP56_16552 [Quercus suber]